MSKLRQEGPTPNGGVAFESIFSDRDGNPCSKEDATNVEIVEYDAGGKVIKRTYAENKPNK